MQLSSLLRPERVKNYQKTALKEDVVKFYEQCLKVQIYDLGKLTGIVLPTSEKGLDGNYYGGEQIITKAQDAGIDLRAIASDVLDLFAIAKDVVDQLVKMGWKDAVATVDDERTTVTIDLVEAE